MDLSVVTGAQLSKGIDVQTCANESKWILAPVSNHDNLLQDNSPSLFVLPSQDVQCSICKRDLCTHIYQCGEGMHLFCETCVGQSNPYQLYRKSENEEFEQLIRDLNTSSPMIKRQKRDSSIARGFTCAFCKRDGCVSRVRWLENAMQCFTQPCPHPECTERLLPKLMQEHVRECLWRPHKCLWCTHEFHTFYPNEFMDHIQQAHGIQKLNFLPATMLGPHINDPHYYVDLSNLKNLSDSGYILTQRYFQETGCEHSVFLVFTLYQQDALGVKNYELRAIDMTHRKTSNKTHTLSATFFIRNLADTEFAQEQTLLIKYQLFDDQLKLKKHIITLCPNSHLGIQKSR